MTVQEIGREKQWSRIVAKAWADDNFRSRLLSDPAAVLAENGVELPSGTQVRVLEDTDAVRHFTLPPPPTDELTDEDLTLSGVADCGCGGCRGCGGCGCRRC